MIDLLEDQADKWGLPRNPTVSLYGQPLKLLVYDSGVRYSKGFGITNTGRVVARIDTTECIIEFLNADLQLRPFSIIQSYEELRDGPYYAQFLECGEGLFYALAQNPCLMIVETWKCDQGFMNKSPRAWAFAIDIYTNEPGLPRKIAQRLNSHYTNGIIAYTNWTRVFNTFKMLSERYVCIDTWRTLLDGE